MLNSCLICLQCAFSFVWKLTGWDHGSIKHCSLGLTKSSANWWWWTKSCLALATPWTVAHQPPLFMGFLRQEYWRGLPFPSPGDLPDPGIKPKSPALQADSLLTEPPGKILSKLKRFIFGEEGIPWSQHAWVGIQTLMLRNTWLWASHFTSQGLGFFIHNYHKVLRGLHGWYRASTDAHTEVAAWHVPALLTIQMNSIQVSSVQIQTHVWLPCSSASMGTGLVLTFSVISTAGSSCIWS